ncbi:hypothetical protein ACHAXM_001213 [Skeletonema potamos]
MNAKSHTHTRITKKYTSCAQNCYQSYLHTFLICTQTNTTTPKKHCTKQPLSKHTQTHTQLPLTLLKSSTTLPLLVELKSGTTYNGRLISCDHYMNLNLTEVVCTSSDGTQFWKLKECYIRGSSIKYLRLPEEAVDKVREEEEESHHQQRQQQGGGGGRGYGGAGGRGRGRGAGAGGGRGRGGGRSGGSGGRGRGRGGGRGSSS